jgi:LysM repeat protein
MPDQDQVSPADKQHPAQDILGPGALFRYIRTAPRVANRPRSVHIRKSAGTAIGCRHSDGAPPFSRHRHSDGALSALMLIAILLLVGCVRFTYDEPPIPSAYTMSTPTSPPTVASTGIPTEPQEEVLPSTPTAQGPAVLRVHPPVVQLDVDETHLVEVWIDNVERLQSIELQITFNPRYMRVEDANPDVAGVQIGAGVIPLPAQVVQNEADNDAGLIIYHAAQKSGSPASGSGMVASFTARALAEGGSPLSFSVANLQDSEAQLLPTPQQVDGLVVIGTGDVGDIAPEPTAPVLPPTQESPATTTETHHTVQPGENLFRIALQYGTTVDAIVAANGLPDPQSIRTGQVLIIPASLPTDADIYLVQPGDTLYSIARRFNTTVEALAALNGLDPPYTIEVGQSLVVNR